MPGLSHTESFFVGSCSFSFSWRPPGTLLFCLEYCLFGIFFFRQRETLLHESVSPTTEYKCTFSPQSIPRRGLIHICCLNSLEQQELRLHACAFNAVDPFLSLGSPHVATIIMYPYLNLYT